MPSRSPKSSISDDHSNNRTENSHCPACKKLVSDAGVQCDLCSNWVHNKCSGFTSAQLSLISGHNAILFQCASCVAGGGLLSCMKSMQNQIECLTQRICDLEHRKSGEFEMVYGAIEEYFERDKKRNNMVAHALPLSMNVGDKEADLNNVKDLAAKAGGDPESIVDVFRL